MESDTGNGAYLRGHSTGRGARAWSAGIRVRGCPAGAEISASLGLAEYFDLTGSNLKKKFNLMTIQAAGNRM